jgi:hypothetical protein
MADETQVVEPQVQAPAPDVTSSPVVSDPFSLDENSLASLSPEQRASLDPIFSTWKQKAMEEISKRESSVSDKFKPYQEKATALDKLTKYAPFVQWWNEQQKAQSSPTQSTGDTPQIATPEEWQSAIYDASQGDGGKLQALQSKLLSQWATPVVQELRARQQKIDTQIELKDLFESHPDAKELDRIGLDPKTGEGTSILEMALEWAERNHRPMEDGYSMAKKWADNFTVGAQQKAMGMIQDKRGSVTEGQTTNKTNVNLIEVENQDELMRRSMEAQLSGQHDLRFIIKGSRR